MCREGFDRKACAALVSNGLLPADRDTARALQELHPIHAAPSCPPVDSLPQAYDIELETLEKVLHSFPPDSGPGPSALRMEHILEALTPANRHAVLQQLLGVVNLLARGQVPAPVSVFAAGAGLVALPKPKGGVRPIAVGEVLRRITGKCLCAAVKEEAQSFFAPLQVGVACPSGVDGAVHACSLAGWACKPDAPAA